LILKIKPTKQICLVGSTLAPHRLGGQLMQTMNQRTQPKQYDFTPIKNKSIEMKYISKLISG
jgi:hypothetical protein